MSIEFFYRRVRFVGNHCHHAARILQPFQHFQNAGIWRRTHLTVFLIIPAVFSEYFFFLLLRGSGRNSTMNQVSCTVAEECGCLFRCNFRHMMPGQNGIHSIMQIIQRVQQSSVKVEK